MSTLAIISSQLQDQNNIFETGINKVGDGVNGLSSSLTSFIKQLTRQYDSEQYDELERKREEQQQRTEVTAVAKKVSNGDQGQKDGGILSGLLGSLGSVGGLAALAAGGAALLSSTARKAIGFAAANTVTDIVVGGLDLDEETQAAIKRSVAAGVGAKLLGFSTKFSVLGALLAGLFTEEAQAELDRLTTQIGETSEALGPIYEQAVKDLGELTNGWIALPETLAKIKEYIPTISGMINQLTQAAEEIEKAAKGNEFSAMEIAEGAAVVGGSIYAGKKLLGRKPNKPDTPVEPEKPTTKVKKPGSFDRLFGAATGSEVSKVDKPKVNPTLGNIGDADIEIKYKDPASTATNQAAKKATGIGIRLLKGASSALGLALTPNTTADPELDMTDPNLVDTNALLNKYLVTTTSQTAKTLGVMKSDQPFFGYGGTDLSAQTAPVVDLSTNTTIKGGDQSIAFPMNPPIDWRFDPTRD